LAPKVNLWALYRTFHAKPLVQGDVGLSVKKREFHALYGFGLSVSDVIGQDIISC